MKSKLKLKEALQAKEVNEGDVSVEALAAYYEPAYSGMYMELRLTDLTGAGRLSDSLVFLWDNGYISDLQLNTGDVKITVIDENTVIAGLFFTPHIQGRTVIFDRIVSGETTIAGNWEFSISSENVLKERILYGEFEGYKAEVFIGGTGVEIAIFADYTSEQFPYTGFPYEIDTEEAMVINLADGTTAHTRFNSSLCDNTPMATFGYGMSFVNPEDVVSITFCGTTISG